jgi:type IV secretory pathway VirB3-like protein
MIEDLARQMNPYAYLAICVIGWFIVRIMCQIDRNQTELWGHMDDHEKRLAHIEGEHKAFTGKGGHEE